MANYCNPDPVPPLIPVCNDPEFCEELHLARCVKYEGDPLPAINVVDGERLHDILVKINAAFGSIVTGTFVTSGTGTTTAFNIPHGLTSLPTAVQVTPGSAVAATTPYFVGLTPTHISVTFTTAPAAGANNIRLHWLVKP